MTPIVVIDHVSRHYRGGTTALDDVSTSLQTDTITRVALDPVGTPVSPTPGVVNPRPFNVNVTDGTNILSIGVVAPSNCPP